MKKKEKTKYFFTKVVTFVKKYFKTFIAIIFIIISSVFYKIITVVLAKVNLAIISEYGMLDGSLAIFSYLTTISILMVVTYFIYRNKFFKILQFFKIEVKKITKPKKPKKLLLTSFLVLVFFVSLPAIFVIHLKFFFKGIQISWLVILFFLSNITTTALTIIGAKILGSNPFIFYGIVVLFLIVTISKKIKNHKNQFKTKSVPD